MPQGSPGSCHTQTLDTRHQDYTPLPLARVQKKGMEANGALIAVIGDEETVTGMLLAGVGNVDARRTSNFMVVDSSQLLPRTTTSNPPHLCPSSCPQRRHRRKLRTPSSVSRPARTSPSFSSTNMYASAPLKSVPRCWEPTQCVCAADRVEDQASH